MEVSLPISINELVETIGKIYLLSGVATAVIYSLRGPHQWPAFLCCLFTPPLVWFFAVRHLEAIMTPVCIPSHTEWQIGV